MVKGKWVQISKGKWINMSLVSKVDFTVEGGYIYYSWPGTALNGGTFAVHFESVDKEEADSLWRWLRG